jgi:Plasmid stabilization system protein
MKKRELVWTPAVRSKLARFRSERFTPEETLDFIAEFILETEALLSTPALSKAYTEESGAFAGLSRIVIKKFRVYFEQHENQVVILAVLFPGEK